MGEGQVAVGDFYPRLPQTRTCAISAYGSSNDGFAMQQCCTPETLSWAVSVIRIPSSMPRSVFPDPGSNIRHPLSVLPSLHRVQRDQFPGFISTMRVLRHPTAISPHFVAFAWRYLNVHSLFSLPGRRVHSQGLELVEVVPKFGVRSGLMMTGQGKGQNDSKEQEARSRNSPSVHR